MSLPHSAKLKLLLLCLSGALSLGSVHAAQAQAASPDSSSSSAMTGDELRALTAQRSQTRYLAPGLLLGVGGAGALLGVAEYGMAGMCSISESDNACDDLDEKQTIAALVGVSGFVLALGGLMWLLSEKQAEAKLEARIQELQSTHTTKVTWHIAAGPDRASAELRIQF